MTTEKPDGTQPEPEEPREPAEPAAEEPQEPMAAAPESDTYEAGAEAEPALDDEDADEEEAAEEEAAAAAAVGADTVRGRRPGPVVATGTRSEGYRGSLPPRNDRLAAPWVLLVVAIFVLILLLSALGLPSSLLTSSPSPEPSVVPSASVPAASGSAGASLVASPAP